MISNDGLLAPAGGTFMFDASSTSTTPLGPWGAAITVNAGGTLDLNGVGCMKNYALTLAGGTLQNSGADGAWICDIALTADSKISYPNVGTGKNDISVAANAEWDLGGHLLTVAFAGTDPDLHFMTAPAAKIHNGTIKTTGGGFFNDYVGVDASDRVTYDFASQLRLRSNASVSNFICRTTFNSVVTVRTRRPSGSDPQPAGGNRPALAAEALQRTDFEPIRPLCRKDLGSGTIQSGPSDAP